MYPVCYTLDPIMRKKITSSDLRKRADELIQSGKMPSLETVLKAVAETRKKFVPMILKVRKESK